MLSCGVSPGFGSLRVSCLSLRVVDSVSVFRALRFPGLAIALGPSNIIRAMSYKVLVRLGVHPACRLKPKERPGSRFFEQPRLRDVPEDDRWRDEGLLFGHLNLRLGLGPPDWLSNPRTGARVDSHLPWWQIPDFDEEVGDIKMLWETSRFEFAIPFMKRAVGGDAASLERLNLWLQDWCDRNPAYQGPNWKCGQECSLRILHLSAALLISGTQPSAALKWFVRTHIDRIRPTIAYAISQNNNHGTSEASALFVGGLVLDDAEVVRLGRCMLENRVKALVADDGTFSQYSTNYHRLMLDTVTFAELFRRTINSPAFAPEFYARMTAAVSWLADLTDGSTGEAPNLGANDGARVLAFLPTRHSDMRPTVQLGALLFAGAVLYEEALPLSDLEMTFGTRLAGEVGALPVRHARPRSVEVLRANDTMAMLRLPEYAFRPSQCDCLHLDIWRHHQPIAMDGGTYSYNSSLPICDELVGTRGHNTVEFDGRDQMPRVGRFLFASWPSGEVTRSSDVFSASYRDYKGCTHRRAVSLTPNSVTISDTVDGFTGSAVLRWRLMQGDWQRSKGGDFTLADVTISITSDAPIDAALSTMPQSPTYQSAFQAPALVITASQRGSTVRTVFTWAKTGTSQEMGTPT